MCGIAGFFDLREPATATRMRAMTDRLKHRGPNAEGLLLVDSRSGRTWTDAGAASATFDLALGHRRLSILDLSDANASQPSPCE